MDEDYDNSHMANFMAESVINDNIPEPKSQKKYKDFRIEIILAIIEEAINNEESDFPKLYKRIKDA